MAEVTTSPQGWADTDTRQLPLLGMQPVSHSGGSSGALCQLRPQTWGMQSCLEIAACRVFLASAALLLDHGDPRDFGDRLFQLERLRPGAGTVT